MKMVNVNGVDKLSQALYEKQKRARTRCVSADFIKIKSLAATKFLKKNHGLSAGEQIGCKVRFQNGFGRFSNSYRGAPYSTWFDLERRAVGWFVTDIFRDYADRDELFIFLNRKEIIEAAVVA